MKLSKNEKSLLMYLESRLVDHYGRVDMQRVNEDERKIIEKWSDGGFIKFGRIALKDAKRDGACWVQFTDQAWTVAHFARREMADRLWEHRGYMTTDEKRADKAGDA